MDSLLKVPMPLSVSLGEAKIKGRELMSLKPGDIISLDKTISEPLVVSIAGRPMFQGRPGRIKDRLYLKVNSRINPDDDELPPVDLAGT
jgi:flagellar motor switch protein FliM